MDYIGMIKDCIKRGMKDVDIIRFIDNAYGIHDRGRNPRYIEFDKDALRVMRKNIKDARREMIE